jgi:hypothetical protein
VSFHAAIHARLKLFQMPNCLNRFVLMTEPKANYLAIPLSMTVIASIHCGEVNDFQLHLQTHLFCIRPKSKIRCGIQT